MANQANTTASSTGGNNNPRFRAQRLYLKIRLCMKVVDEILEDASQTAIQEFLSPEDFQIFRKAVQAAVRTNIDATMDSWQRRTVHDYMPNAREAILKAVEEEWNLFAVDVYDDFVPSEIVHDAFYEVMTKRALEHKHPTESSEQNRELRAQNGFSR